LLLDDNEDGTLADELVHMLQQLDSARNETNQALEPVSNRIHIETKAFTGRERKESHLLGHCEFVDGWIENTTSEPDSRFDRKLRGHDHGSGSVGKIRLEGASEQALQSFQHKSDKGSDVSPSSSSFARPLLAVCTPGNIMLETLSWMGNIARRYGLDETREKDDLGRQATRRGRLVGPSDE